MIKDNLFKRSLCISIFIHFAILIPWGGSSLRTKFKENSTSSPILVAYEIKDKNVIEHNQPEKTDKKVKKEDSKQTEKKVVAKPEETPNSEVASVRKNLYQVEENQIVSLSENVNAETIPESVLNYYNAVREEIKKKAFYYKPRFKGRGAVTVLFGISSDGILQSIMIDENNSAKYEVLRNAAFKSVKYAAPFPPFPEELKNDAITCSITIEFELGGR